MSRIVSPPRAKGEIGCAFVVLRDGRQPSEALRQTLRDLVRKTLGHIVIVNAICFVTELPKTRSGKIMRRVIKAIITGKPLGDHSTIEDESSIEELYKASKG